MRERSSTEREPRYPSASEARLDQLFYAVAAEPDEELDLPAELTSARVAGDVRSFLGAAGSSTSAAGRRTRGISATRSSAPTGAGGRAFRGLPSLVAAAVAGLILGIGGATLWLRGAQEWSSGRAERGEVSRRPAHAADTAQTVEARSGEPSWYERVIRPPRQEGEEPLRLASARAGANPVRACSPGTTRAASRESESWYCSSVSRKVR